ncbi:hypothetical protein MM817_02705 [Acidibacillus sp. S0AB]|uniref:Uncharacterized protein n=2 Tax=Sulfoacidibacillus ferrooxidans TaxID=2005001 RepID=A0A9X1VE03_9BACL|nr:hypothetical protein [Sulfoacidibacillus ferrooxidans]
MAALAMTCLVVTGCGVSNHLTGTSASDSPSATVQPSDRTTTPSTSPSSSSTITPSASNSTRPAPTSHLSSTGTKDSTVSVDEMRASSNERFSSIITRAMAHVTKTKFALMAPTLPDYSPKSRVPLSMGAVVQSSADSYSVNLQWAHSQLPINSPSLSMPPNTGDAGIIGSFGATQYPSAKTALAHLNIQQMNPHLSPPTNSKNTTVDLGHGIQGLSYSSFPGMVIWHQGDWTLEMRGLALPPIQKAKEIVTYLHTHNLPPTNGVFIVVMAADGDHTSAQWVFGKVVYSCSDYHSALQAAKMAVSMRVYPPESPHG